MTAGWADRNRLPSRSVSCRITHHTRKHGIGDGPLEPTVAARQREGDPTAANPQTLQDLKRIVGALQQHPARWALEPEVAGFGAVGSADGQFPSRMDRLTMGRDDHEQRRHGHYLEDMAPKLSPRQLLQQAWLDTLPPKFERIKKVIELLATHHADEAQVRGLQRLFDELKAQASQVNLTPLAENFGYMGMLLRRAGGHQTKVRGLHELLAGAKINFEGACREASTPATPDVEEEEDVSP
jgi:hypothetical protein